MIMTGGVAIAMIKRFNRDAEVGFQPLCGKLDVGLSRHDHSRIHQRGF
jgi:hypothetical protein